MCLAQGSTPGEFVVLHIFANRSVPNPPIRNAYIRFPFDVDRGDECAHESLSGNHNSEVTQLLHLQQHQLCSHFFQPPLPCSAYASLPQDDDVHLRSWKETNVAIQQTEILYESLGKEGRSCNTRPHEKALLVHRQFRLQLDRQEFSPRRLKRMFDRTENLDYRA